MVTSLTLTQNLKRQEEIRNELDEQIVAELSQIKHPELEREIREAIYQKGLDEAGNEDEVNKKDIESQAHEYNDLVEKISGSELVITTVGEEVHLGNVVIKELGEAKAQAIIQKLGALLDEWYNLIEASASLKAQIQQA